MAIKRRTSQSCHLALSPYSHPFAQPSLVMSSARYKIILPLPSLRVATTTENLACEPNQQHKEAQSCWIDQPDLTYSWLPNIPLREPKITNQLPRCVPKIQLHPEPVIFWLPEPTATDYKPAITPQNVKPAKPKKRATLRLCFKSMPTF